MGAPKSSAKLPAKLLERHRVFNRNSENRWDSFASHRAEVMRLLTTTGPGPGGRVVILGAGNCNDLDLPALLQRFAEVHLVDVDEGALGKAPQRQGIDPAAQPNLFLHAPLDVTGALPRLAEWGKRPADDPAFAGTALESLATACVDEVKAALPGSFDVVVSACILSQLMHTLRLALGERHGALADVAHTMAVAHLRALLGLTAPGGTALLITDTAASTTYPLVELWNDQPPEALLDQLERADNLLSGTGPSYLRRLLLRDPVTRPLLAGSPRVVTPWLWNLGDDVTLMAYALACSRTS